MTHIDEHTLELFVLGAKEVQRRKKTIEAHLKKCEGCRTLVRTMTEFYANAESHRKSQPQSKPLSDSQTLIRSHTEIEPTYDPYYSTFKTPVPARMPRTFLQHVFSYARQNPIKSVIGSFALFVGLALIFNFTLKTIFKDANPAYAILSERNSALEVYNREDEKLWQLFQPQIKTTIGVDDKWGISHTEVADLNGDGRNEVITTLPLPAENDGRAKALRVYDAERKLVIEKKFENTMINFLSNRYETSFEFSSILVDGFGGEGRKEIFASVDNGRSPWFLARLDAKGQTIGRYWHFGHCLGVYAIDLNNDGRKEIILSGVNQVSDLQLKQFVVVAVLDPQKIIGDVEATATRGFGFGRSDAEIFYIQIPASDMVGALGQTQNISLISSTDEQQLRFRTSSSAPDGFPQFEYIFSKDMQVRDVKYADQDVLLHARLKKEGKIHSIFNRAYLENLKQGVRYWNGKEWRKEVTKVKHDVKTTP
jgi:hypothetical protein